MTHFRPDRTNITVNYEGMNFGQSVAYGALGSLTGGSCGLNSVWQMPRYPYMAGGCCSSSNSQIVGNAILGGINMLFQCVHSYHSDRKEAKAVNEEKVATAKSNVKALNKEIAALESEQEALKVDINTATDLSGVKKYLLTQYNAYDSAKTAFDAYQNKKDIYTQKITELEEIQNDNPETIKRINALKLEQVEKKVEAKTAFDSAKRELSKAISERKAEIKEQLETKTNDRDEAQEIIDGAKTTTSAPSASTQPDPNASLSEKINDYDSNTASRKFGLTKNSDLKSKLAAFRKASDKLAQDPFSLTKDELEILNNSTTLASELNNKDVTETANAIYTDLSGFAEKNKNKLEQLKRIIIDKKPNVNDLNTPYYKKQDRMVNGKNYTIYNGRNSSDEYIIENNNVVPITQVRDGNLFHKATYKK